METAATERPAQALRRLTALYLLLALTPMLGPRRPAVWPLVVAAHVLLAAALLAMRRRSLLRDWLPLIVLPLLYREIALLNQSWGEGYRDSSVLELDARLFASHSAGALAARWPWRGLSELLHLCYLSYYPILYLPPLWLYLQRRFDQFDRAVLVMMAGFYTCYLVFLHFPVEGPRYLGPAPAAIPPGSIRKLTLAILEAGSARGSAFPSSHVAAAVIQTWTVWLCWPRIAPLVLVLTVGLALGAVYGGFHYPIDVVAGAALGLALAATGHALRDRGLYRGRASG